MKGLHARFPSSRELHLDPYGHVIMVDVIILEAYGGHHLVTVDGVGTACCSGPKIDARV